MLDLQRSTINNHIPLRHGFKLASLNVNKLSTHIDEIRVLLADKCLDVLAIQETKLDVSNNNSDFYICGRGTCFYIKSTINFSMWTDLNIDSLKNCVSKFASRTLNLLLLSIGIGLLILQQGL